MYAYSHCVDEHAHLRFSRGSITRGTRFARIATTIILSTSMLAFNKLVKVLIEAPFFFVWHLFWLGLVRHEVRKVTVLSGTPAKKESAPRKRVPGTRYLVVVYAQGERCDGGWGSYVIGWR